MGWVDACLLQSRDRCSVSAGGVEAVIHDGGRYWILRC